MEVILRALRVGVEYGLSDKSETSKRAEKVANSTLKFLKSVSRMMLEQRLRQKEVG